VLPYVDPELEKLYSFGRALLPHLPTDRDQTRVQLTDDVALQYCRLERIHSGPVDVREGEPAGVYGPTEVGTGVSTDEQAPLSQIISTLNERFGTTFTDKDRLFFEQIKEQACTDERIVETALANPEDKFLVGIRHLIQQAVLQCLGDNEEIVTRYLDDTEFQEAAYDPLGRAIYQTIRKRVVGEE
jgi:type I restriction enzyme R subunit